MAWAQLETQIRKSSQFAQKDYSWNEWYITNEDIRPLDTNAGS